MKKGNNGCIAGVIVLIAVAIGAQGGIVGVFVALIIVAVLAFAVISITTKPSSKNNINNYVQNQNTSLLESNSLGEYDATDHPELTEIFQFEKLIDGSYKIVKYIGFDDEEINIPKTYTGVSITEIQEGIFQNCKSLHSIVIEANISKIPKMAFAYCENLKNIVLPQLLTAIGYGAFYNCKSLTEYNGPLVKTNFK